MGPPVSLSDNDSVLVADASTVISLNATGCAEEIIGALPYRIAVVDVVAEELESGRSKGRNDAGKLAALVKANLVQVVTLGQEGLLHFESLVIGAATETLDDGEAATIAYAAESKARAIIDEKKAIRLCSARFADVPLGCTIDLFTHTGVQRTLGPSRLGDAVHLALVHARTRVLPHHLEWVVQLIGNKRAAQCVCLPEAVRRKLAVTHPMDGATRVIAE